MKSNNNIEMKKHFIVGSDIACGVENGGSAGIPVAPVFTQKSGMRIDLNGQFDAVIHWLSPRRHISADLLSQ